MGSFSFLFFSKEELWFWCIYLFFFVWKEDHVFLFYFVCFFLGGKKHMGFFFGFIMFWEIRRWFWIWEGWGRARRPWFWWVFFGEIRLWFWSSRLSAAAILFIFKKKKFVVLTYFMKCKSFHSLSFLWWVKEKRRKEGRGGGRKTKAILYIKANMVSVCLCGQKLGSAWKILPVTARSLWSWWQTGQGQGRAARAAAVGGRARCHFY